MHIKTIFRYVEKLRTDCSGAYLIEFALILPVFLMFIMATFDLGVQMYARHVLNGSVTEAARNSTLEKNAGNQTAIDNAVREAMNRLGSFGTVTIKRSNFLDYSDINKPELYKDSNSNGRYDPGECFEDANGNGIWDSNRAGSGQGGAVDVVVIDAQFKFNRVFPGWSFLGQPQQATLTASTAIRNQPYGMQRSVVKCS